MRVCNLKSFEKHLVSPNQEVIPIPPGTSTQSLIEKYSRDRAEAHAARVSAGDAAVGLTPGNLLKSWIMGQRPVVVPRPISSV